MNRWENFRAAFVYVLGGIVVGLWVFCILLTVASILVNLSR